MSPPSTPEEVPGVPRLRMRGTRIEISRLGFGTSALMSRVSRRDSCRLLQTAVDEGITHFDTARSYGFGEAEIAVGDLLAGRRDRLTVTTKMGLLPPRRSALLSGSKALARGVLGVLPALRPLLRRGAGGLVQPAHFDPATMAQSLEMSLRQLRTDYVDILLLHEPSCEVLATGAPLEFLRRVQREGKVRLFGIAAQPEVAQYALAHAPEYAGVLQLPSSVFRPVLRQLVREPEIVFTHSTMPRELSGLRRCLLERPELGEDWSSTLGVNVRKKGSLERLAFQYALGESRQSVVLFTSTNAAHIREDAAAARTAASPDQLQRFAELVRKWSADRRTLESR